jgi:hypothetical protein
MSKPQKIGRIGSDYDFTDTTDVFGKAGRKKEIKLAELERVVYRLGQRKDQGICVGTKPQVNVAERPDFKRRAAAREGHGVFVCNGSFFDDRNGSRWFLGRGCSRRRGSVAG